MRSENIATRLPHRARHARVALAFAVLALATLLVFRSAFSAYFMLDDFGMLTIVRFTDDPFALFVGEHIPGGLFYRPVGMLFWWLSEMMFGPQPAWHYLCNVLLHIGAAAALGSLVSRMCTNPRAGFCAALVFAIHPIGIGTTLWLSDRFDLLATLFGLLAMRAAYSFALSGSLRALLATLVLLALGLLSKEIALAPLAAVIVMWTLADPVVGWRRRATATLCAIVLVFGYLGLRALVLPATGIDYLFALKPPLTLFLDGLRVWYSGWMDYASGWPRMNGWRSLLAHAGMLAVGLLAIAACAMPWSAHRRRALLVGLALWAGPALVQWPILGVVDLRMSSATTNLFLVMNARFFHMALPGLLLALAALLMPLCSASRIAQRVLAVALVSLLLPWGLASQHLARSWRNQSLTQQTLARAATEAISRLQVQEHGCQVYLLDTDDWMFGWVSDEAIKAVSPTLRRIEHCLIQTEHAPWYHVAVLDPADPAGMFPMTLIRSPVGQPPPQRIGRAHLLPLNLSARIDPTQARHAFFLGWRQGHFVDVTADVLAGRRSVAFFCNRSPGQCPE